MGLCEVFGKVVCHLAKTLEKVVLITLQSKMNAKLSKHRFWHCHENGLIMTIQTRPIGECQVSFPLLRRGLRRIFVVYD